MFTSINLLLTALFFLIALLYASVGHAGASGYLAVMGLVGMTESVMKPTALVLNILVASVASVEFYRSGNFSWRVFWPFALGSIPFAFIGGALTLPVQYYKPLVGLVLLYSAYRLFTTRLGNGSNITEHQPVPVWLGILIGIGIGLLAGLTGVGGGIFLSPLLVLMNWADARHTAGIAALFILVNSIAGLLGHVSSVTLLPIALPLWAMAVLIGGFVGSFYGSHRFSNVSIKRWLALVLVIASVRMFVDVF